MLRVPLLLVCVAVVGAENASAQLAGPTYQRNRQMEWRGPVNYQSGGGGQQPRYGQQGGYSQPSRYGQPGGNRPAQLGGKYDRRGHRREAPEVASGTFQRPYPYHLDYYKQKYGGSYEPYAGNLYGPPNVVLAPGYGYGFGYGYGGFDDGYRNEAPLNNEYGSGPICPHCGQPWPTPLVAPNAIPQSGSSQPEP